MTIHYTYRELGESYLIISLWHPSKHLAYTDNFIFLTETNPQRQVIKVICMTARHLQIQWSEWLSISLYPNLIPQDSCLPVGPVISGIWSQPELFVSMMSFIYWHLTPVGGYADNHDQLYISVSMAGHEESEVYAIQAMNLLCHSVSYIKAWMLTHQLKINDTKKEFLLTGSNKC